MTVRVGKLRYPRSAALHSFTCVDLPLRPGDSCIARQKDGAHEFAEVRTIPGPLPLDAGCLGCFPSVIRKATDDDRTQRSEHERLERHALQFCKEKVEQRELPMHVLFVERPFEKKRLVFHFEAEERVDFRELVKDMAHMYNMRIEMRQDGVRDFAKTCGGLGPCGKELCCSQYLPQFEPVSIKMAKQQGLALNPNKISGMCGRLKCCLRYEYDPDAPAKRPRRKRRGGNPTPPEQFDV